MEASLVLTYFLFAMHTDTVAADVLRYFQRIQGSGVHDYLVKQRPAAVPAEDRASIVAELPSDGEVLPNPVQREKVASIHGVLAAFGRDGIIAVKIVRLPYACVALYARSVLIVAESALDVLTPPEVKAVVAHELAHEYFWDDYYAARDRGDKRQLQKLELLADGIAIASVAPFGVRASRLTAALRHLNAFNQQFGPAVNPDEYPSDEERESFHRAFERLLTAR
jgi:hypothetical protein